MTISLRRRVGDVWVLAEQGNDGSWKIQVLDNKDALPVEGPERDAALAEAMQEILKLHAHLETELKKPEP